LSNIKKKGKLFAQAKSFYQLLVAVDIFLLQVSQQPSALSDKPEQGTLGVKVMAECGHVPGEFLDALGKKGYLHLGGAGVSFVAAVFLDDLGFLL
jgi:hypothetical protein